MSDPTYSSSADAEDLRAVVESTGSKATTSQQASADLKPYIDRVLAMDDFDDVPGAATISPGRKAFTAKIESLPPDLEREVRVQLLDVPEEQRAEREAEFVLKAVKQRVNNNRALTGVGENATPYHRAQAQVARQVQDIDRKIVEYERELRAVVDHRTVTDPQTGKTTAEPVYKLSAERRRGYEAEVENLYRQRRLFVTEEGNAGPQARREVTEALHESAAILQRREQERADALEVERRVAERIREDRINKQVAAKVSLRTNEVG